ncbi:MAG: aldose epimerase family protein [Culicoidibacterales bacterium]
MEQQKLTSWVLKNEDIEVEILNLGAIIYQLKTKNKRGESENIVVGYKDKQEYLRGNNAYFGAVIGPIAGRISKGRYALENQQIQLEINDRKHHLHGSTGGFSTVFWELVAQSGTIITLKHKSKQGITAQVSYQLLANKLIVTYQGKTTEPRALFDMTQHVYWNLSGGLEQTISDHQLQINAQRYIPLDRQGMVRKTSLKVEKTIMDLRKLTVISSIFKRKCKQLQCAGGGLDHPFILGSQKGESAILQHQKSGRKLTITTTHPAIVCYTGNHLSQRLHGGICLETQHIPNAINMKKQKKPIIRSSCDYNHKTVFRFDLLTGKSVIE